MHTPDLHLLAQELEAHGFVGHDTAINAVSRSARAAGLSPVLVDVLSDADAPEVARLRAFGALTSRLSGLRPEPAPQQGTVARRRFRHRPQPVAPAA